MIEEPIQFCPHCGTKLITRLHTGKNRPACPSCGWVYFPDPKVAVAVLIKDSGRLLLVQRRYEPQRGFWTLPSGFVDAGEDPRLAAQRECLEETGMQIESIRLVDVLFSQEHPRGASILILYQAEVKPGEPRPGDDARQAGFINANELPPLAFASTKQIIDTYF